MQSGDSDWACYAFGFGIKLLGLHPEQKKQSSSVEEGGKKERRLTLLEWKHKHMSSWKNTMSPAPKHRSETNQKRKTTGECRTAWLR